jgi:hypothetical protein
MVESSKVNGSKIIWKVLVFIIGVMVVLMRESTQMIRNMVMESIFGLMLESIGDIGAKVNNMV